MKKLNDENVFEIKKLLKESCKQKVIAEKFKIAESTVSRIKKSALHNKIFVPSEDYDRGYQKGCEDTKRLIRLEATLYARNCDKSWT